MTGRKNIFTRTMNGFAKTVTKHPGKISLVFLFVTILMLQPISGIRTQSNMADFMPESEFSEARDVMVEKFNNTEGLIGIVEAESGNILTREGLLLLNDLEERIEGSEIARPYMITHKDPVVSIYDAVEGALRMGSDGAVGVANATDDELAGAIDTVLLQDEYAQLVSKGEDSQRRYAMVLVLVDYKMHADALMQNDESLDIEIENILDDNSQNGYKTYLFGAWSKDMEENTMEDLSVLLPVTFLVLFLILLVALRCFTDILISVSGLLVTLIISFGLFALFGMAFNQLTFFAPIFIMVLSVDFAIHILMRFREEDKGEPKRSMFTALGFVGISITLSTITTMVAFASNGLSSIPAVASFGIFIAMGIFVSFIVMMAFVPSLKLLSRRFGKKGIKKKRSGNLMARGLAKPGRISISHPFVVLFLVVGITLGGLYTATQLERGLAQEDLMASDSVKLTTRDILIKEFPGKSPDWVAIVVEGDIAGPSVLLAMDSTLDNMADDKNVVQTQDGAKALSILTYVKALSGSGANLPGVTDADSNGIPDKREGAVIVLEHLYHNGIAGLVSPQDVRSVLSYDRESGRFGHALITLEITGISDGNTDLLYSDLHEDSEPLSSIPGVRVRYAGAVFEGDDLIKSMTEGMIVCTLISIVICTMLVVVLFRSVRFGVLTSIPVVLVTVWILASIYLLGFKLNPVTATTTAMTVGIGIDYSIHFMERYRQERGKGRTVRSAMDVTTQNTGVALLTAGATTGAGFWIISLSRIAMFHAFGIVAFLIVVYVLAASLLVLPAFVVLSERLHDRLANSRKSYTGSSQSLETEVTD
jgi:predicted RND superfamily exporter protein